MNRNDADQLIDWVLEGGRAELIINAFQLGFEYYDMNKNGVDCLNEYHFTTIARRMLSASIFTAFDFFDWENSGLTSEHDTQRSSHRTYLRLGDIWIDIVRNGRSEANFYDERFRKNWTQGMEGNRYIQLNYTTNVDGVLDRIEIRVPRSKSTMIAIRRIYPDELR